MSLSPTTAPASPQHMALQPFQLPSAAKANLPIILRDADEAGSAERKMVEVVTEESRKTTSLFLKSKKSTLARIDELEKSFKAVVEMNEKLQAEIDQLQAALAERDLFIETHIENLSEQGKNLEKEASASEASNAALCKKIDERQVHVPLCLAAAMCAASIKLNPQRAYYGIMAASADGFQGGNSHARLQFLLSKIPPQYHERVQNSNYPLNEVFKQENEADTAAICANSLSVKKKVEEYNKKISSLEAGYKKIKSNEKEEEKAEESH